MNQPAIEIDDHQVDLLSGLREVTFSYLVFRPDSFGTPDVTGEPLPLSPLLPEAQVCNKAEEDGILADFFFGLRTI